MHSCPSWRKCSAPLSSASLARQLSTEQPSDTSQQLAVQPSAQLATTQDSKRLSILRHRSTAVQGPRENVANFTTDAEQIVETIRRPNALDMDTVRPCVRLVIETALFHDALFHNKLRQTCTAHMLAPLLHRKCPQDQVCSIQAQKVS